MKSPLAPLMLVLALLNLTACERIVGLDTATAQLEQHDASSPLNCDVTASPQAGEDQTPLFIPRAPDNLSLAFPVSDDWCRSPRVTIAKTKDAQATVGGFRVLWSPEALWVLITWDDDRWFTTNFFGYDNDGFELMVNSDGSTGSDLDESDAQISVVAGTRQIAAITEGAPQHLFPTADVKYDMTGDTIRYLLRLPWSEMSAPMAVAGQRMGLELRIRDTDGEKSTRATWWHSATSSDRDPRTWGTAVLR